MNILTLDHIEKGLGSRLLFQNVSLGIDDQERIGVVGVNGTGKSTLLAITAGEVEPDEGCAIRKNGLRISYLSQNPVFDPRKTVLENAAGLVQGKEEHWNTIGEARSLLTRLGIRDPDCSPDILSGGQKKRAALAAALLTPCDLLILDEPTNHLDHDMIEWLQEWLEGFKGALLMVTHDRYFLDEVTHTIWEIDKKSIYRYEANFEGYLEKKQERMDFALASERKMAALYKKDLAWIMRGARARSTKQKAHIQRFEALRDRDKIVEERNVEISSLASRMGNKTVELTGLSKAYGDHVLFRDFSYTFLKSDRIGLIGPNGCGKSTLLKVMLGLIPADSGQVEVGQTIRFGYFSQNNEALDDQARVIDYIKDAAEYIRTAEGLVSASSMCERFLFDADTQYAPISKLSGGEKRRLYLLRILMGAPNFLILDEPTNDLDIQTLQVLEDYLDHFAGIVVVVSHDRYFLDRTVNRIFSFEPDGTLMQSEGGYEEYRERTAARESTAAADSGMSAKRAEPDPPRSNTRAPKPKTRLTYKEQKEYDEIEGIIDAMTEESALLDRQIMEASADYTRLQELTERKAALEEELDAKINRYLELQELAESLGVQHENFQKS